MEALCRGRRAAALLTHNQLPHFLPADVAACLMHQGHSDPPLYALSATRPRENTAVVNIPTTKPPAMAGTKKGYRGGRLGVQG